MKGLFRQNGWQMTLIAGAVALLLMLFVRAQPVDPDMHNLVVRDIAELQRKDTELGEAVLQLHYHLTNNYDAVAALMRRIDELDHALDQHLETGALPDNSQMRQALDELHSQIEYKSRQLEEFKSGNAVMKNSLIYLPVMTGDLLSQLPRSNEPLLEKFEVLLRDALLLSVKGDEPSFAALETDILMVQRVLPSLSEKPRELAHYVVRHAQTLLEAERAIPGLLAGLSSYQSQHLGSSLDALYQDYYQQQQRTAALYRLFLLIAAMAMLAYSIYVYFRLREKRRQLETALAEIGNQQQALNEHAIVSITDVKGNITYVNDKFQKISGYLAEELIGQNHRMIQSGEHSREFFRELWQTVSGGQVWHGQIKNRAKDGSYYWVEATIVPFMDQNGKPYQYVAMRTEITAQKDMEQQIMAERRLLQNVMDTLGEGVYMLDLAGNCTYLNREAEAIIGWTIDEARGRNLHDLIHTELPDGGELSQADCPVRIATMENRLYRSETDYFQHKNGTLFPISIVASPMYDGDRIVGTVAAFQDISERKFFERELLRAKETAEAASSAKGSFLATMSHEIRTPMNGIIGMTELALDTELDPLQREYLNMVKFSADALLTIINDILDFSKIESGKMQLELVDFDVRSLCSAAEKTLALRAGQRGLELVYDVDGEIPDKLTGDPGRLRQVLINLLGNAIKFSERGVVTLNMRQVKSSAKAVTVRVEVIDQGIGISEQQQRHIFDAFTQADASTTRKYGGTGLGLAISSQLVAAMGGQLAVQSELGHGSVFSFTITLPIANQQTEPPSAVAGLSALIVDDNETNRQLLLQTLRKWQMKPLAAAGAADARAMVNEAKCEGIPFDLVLIDSAMPDCDGFELAAELRGIPTVMMLSAARMRADADRCEQTGIDAFFSKPVDRHELFDAIAKALGVSQDVAAERRSHSVVPMRRLKVLLAEDNRVNQKLAISLLEKWGHSVVLANNGLEAVEKSSEQAFDVILMDLQMPEMGGLEATELIRERDAAQHRHTPIVAMTANAMSEDRQRCLDAGMDDYLSKPLNSEKMRALLQALPAGDEPAAEPVAPAFDYKGALERTEDWVIETIGHAFLDESDLLQQEMRAAIAQGDSEQLTRSAHTLRGLVGNFNASGAEAAARHVEKLASEGDAEEIEAAYAALQSEMVLLKAALVEHLNAR